MKIIFESFRYVEETSSADSIESKGYAIVGISAVTGKGRVSVTQKNPKIITAFILHNKSIEI